MNLPVSNNGRPIDENGGQQQEERQYLAFTLGDETFALGILKIREILEYGQLTPIPMMPDYIRGVINLRGAVVPVVDLAARLGRQSGTVTKRTCIVITEVRSEEEHQEIGVVVDAVSEVLEIPPSEIEPAPTLGTRIRTDFIRGMGKVNGQFIIILNVNKVLSIEDLALLDQAAEPVPEGGSAV